jgi:hypothetical protein
MDTDAELSDSWWERVKYYARLAIERVEYGVESVKELLSTLTIDERCGVMLEFEDLHLISLLNCLWMRHSGLNGWRDFPFHIGQLTVNSSSIC